SLLRAGALLFEGLTPFAWPLLELADGAWSLFRPGGGPWPLPENAGVLSLLGLWALESAAEFAVAAFLTRYGAVLWWALDRWVLEPFLLRPTEWLLERLTVWYAVTLRLALRAWVARLGV